MLNPSSRLVDVLRAARGRLPQVPVRARHAEWSVISSADDLPFQSAADLVPILLQAAAIANITDLGWLADRSTAEDAAFVRTWPGEHYRLLTALATVQGGMRAVEVGTFRGHGALALRAGLPSGGTVVTYDVLPWREIPGTVLHDGDLDAIEPRLGDLADPSYLASQLGTLKAADILFVDGPKDGVFEPAFCATVLPALADRRRLVIFDDVRVLKMVQLWRDLPFAKLDGTSLGHWSGTGLILTA